MQKQKQIKPVNKLIHGVLTKENLKKDNVKKDNVKKDNVKKEKSITLQNYSLFDFYRLDSPNILEKCNRFHNAIENLHKENIHQTMYRVPLTSGLDHRILIKNSVTGTEDEFICFDSNSYLGLHRDPRVIEAVKKALSHVGYGTPSAQLLSGTNRYLIELEETVSKFHGREDTLIFPSGYAANIGIISGMVRKKDATFRDRFSHASIHDACRALNTRANFIYPHNDQNKLESMLQENTSQQGSMGKLIITDGVFSMSGNIASLPELVDLAKRYSATLMVDEAHSVGVLGKNGRGIEDHFDLPQSIDILMGTFSKAPGTAGGYVTGSKELVNYLRFFANSSVFTASIPAAMCAGITEAFNIMMNESEHREMLWNNIRTLASLFKVAGFNLSQPDSPILTVFIGSNKLLYAFGQELFSAGIKCGNVSYPAVPRGEAILRFTLNARHTNDDLERCADIMTTIGKKYGILNKSRKEIQEIGEKL